MHAYADRAKIMDVAAEIQRGECVIIPTECEYAIAASPFTSSGLVALKEWKQWPPTHPVTILISDPELLPAYTTMTAAMQMFASRYWPGPLTMVVRGYSSLPLSFTTDGYLSLRVPDDNVLRQLLRQTGPLAVTALASPDMEPVSTMEEGLELTHREFDSIDGGPRTGVRSTVVDLTEFTVQLLREGAIPRREMEDANLLATLADHETATNQESLRRLEEKAAEPVEPE